MYIQVAESPEISNTVFFLLQTPALSKESINIKLFYQQYFWTFVGKKICVICLYFSICISWQYSRIRSAATDGMEGGGDGKEQTQRQAVDNGGDGLGGIYRASEKLSGSERRWSYAYSVCAYVGYILHLQENMYQVTK